MTDYDNEKIPYTIWFSLRLGLILFTIYRTLLLIFIIVERILHTNKFTYWNYVFQWLFDFVYLFATFTEGRFLMFLTIYFLPMVFGSTILVSILIVIIIQRNDWEYIEATIFGIGEFKVGDIHTADWIVHVAPLIERFVLLYLGQLTISRTIISNLLETRSETLFGCRWHIFYLKFKIYLVLWILSPTFPLILFSIFYDPLKEYPTGFNFIQAIVIVLFTDIIAQSFTFLGITASNNIYLILGDQKSHYHRPHKLHNVSYIGENIKVDDIRL